MANNSASPVNHGQCLPETSSRCVTESVTATHSFEVTDFSLLDGMGIGKFVSSSTFSVGGCDWNIRLYPDGSKEEDKAAHVSVFLYFCRGAAGVRVNFSLSLLDKDGGASKLQPLSMLQHTFEAVGGGWGLSKFIEKSKMQKLVSLNDDCLTIRCVITVIKESRSEVVNKIAVPRSNLHQDLARMLKDGEGTDVTFSVGDQLFPAHKCVLSARSPVFHAELLGPMKKKPGHHIKIDDMEPTIFEALLHIIYTDTLSDSCNADKIVAMQHLLVAADRYGLDRLRMMCEAKLCHDIDVQTVATTLTLAEQHHCVQLKDDCLRFIASGDVLVAVLKTDGFKHLVASCPLVIKEILDKIVPARPSTTAVADAMQNRLYI